jgi:hypothetical protein
MKKEPSLDHLYEGGSMSLEDTHKAIWEATKKPNPFQSLEALYEWVRGDVSMEMASPGYIEEPGFGKRVVSIYNDEYEFETPHFNLEVSRPSTVPLPVAKIAIPEAEFLTDKTMELEVLWVHKDYPLSKKDLKVIAKWLRKNSKSDKKEFKTFTNLQAVKFLWDSQVRSQSFGQVRHR